MARKTTEIVVRRTGTTTKIMTRQQNHKMKNWNVNWKNNKNTTTNKRLKRWQKE